MNPLLEQFLQEARENLAFIDQNIEQIGSNDPELLNAIFRAAHTLKGGSGIVGFEGVKEITHHAEDLLDMLRSGKLMFEDSMVESLYDAFDEVMNLVEAAEESGDIVDADPATLDRIVAKLSAHMGKSETSEAWSCPFMLLEDVSGLVNVPMPFLRSLNTTLPFHLGAMGETACSAEQLYAVVFDVDESCMVYGNDPVYALSLLGDKVLGIHTCMSDASARAVLSGMDDPEGLQLQLQMTAFIYATYAEIEDALYNFIDELLFHPFDIVTLLQVSRGESGHKMDLLKELEDVAAELLATGNKQALEAEIAKSMQLLGRETLQYAQLERLADMLGCIDGAELSKLGCFLTAVSEGNVYRYLPESAEEATAAVAEPGAEPGAEAVTEAVSGPMDIDDAMRAQANVMLEQQLVALQCCEDRATYERVLAIVDGYLRPCFPDMPASFADAAELGGWMAGITGQSYTVNTPSAATAPTLKTEQPAAEVTVLETPLATAVEEPETASDRTGKPASKEPGKEVTKKSVIGKTVKIEQESVDNLMNIVGELLVAKNSLPYLADSVGGMNPGMIRRAIMEKYTFINRLAEQLQDIIMSMRMLPISYVFDRYPKLVRDISKDLGKKVKLTMEGGETKLDKNMIEMLADPMIHIMRNSLDHGIERPDTREANGKSGEGNIHLKAYAQSDKIIIEIKDDGAGINVEKVVNKVLEKGLVSIEKLDEMSHDEKAELVMLPGLSTADTISEYSGRGVGMDVVKKSIETFGGTIRIRTVPNQGTTIVLSIPVSLAVTSLLHVMMSGVHYGFPMDSVSETVKIEKSEIEYLHNEPFVYIRGEVIPLLFVKAMLNEEALADKPLPIVVLNIKGNMLAVVVNELLGQLDVVQKPLEGVMEDHPIFSGTALLGNGQIIMAIDPLGLLGIAHVLKEDQAKAG